MSPSPEQFSLTRLAELASLRATDSVWLDDSGASSWTDFAGRLAAAQAVCQQAGLEPGSVVITPGEASLDSLVWLLAVASGGGVAAPLRRERLGETENWLGTVAIGWQVRGGALSRVGRGSHNAETARLLAQLQARGHPGLILATSGTSGKPKLLLHDLAALLATVPVRTGRPLRTLPLMRFDHIGGLDMAWRALAGGHPLVAPPAELSPEGVAQTIARHRVEVMPATPSFLNLLLLSGAAGRWDLNSLRIVPYGAEPMPAGLLTRLQAALPAVNFVQRFGTSETGALPVRNVGARLVLDDRPDGFRWKLVGDELWIRSPSRALGYLSGDTGALDADGWFRTGDLAEQRSDGTVVVLGRRSELINVGGEKVFPSEVEGVLLDHPLVADCRVTPLANAVLGQVVAAEVVWRGPESDVLSIKRQLHVHAAPRLARHKLPTVIRLVSAVASTRNLKKARSLSP